MVYRLKVVLHKTKVMKKIGALLFAVLLVLFLLRPPEGVLIDCSIGMEMRLFDTEDCKQYFEVFGVSTSAHEYLKQTYTVATLLNSTSEFKYFLAQELIDSGIDINKEIIPGGLPIHNAIYSNDIKALMWLLERGANPNLISSQSNVNAFELLEFMQNKTFTPEREKMSEILSSYYIATDYE